MSAFLHPTSFFSFYQLLQVFEQISSSQWGLHYVKMLPPFMPPFPYATIEHGTIPMHYPENQKFWPCWVKLLVYYSYPGLLPLHNHTLKLGRASVTERTKHLFIGLLLVTWKQKPHLVVLLTHHDVRLNSYQNQPNLLLL